MAIGAAAHGVRRGDNMRLDLTVRNGARAGKRLRVGLVCIERYDVEESSSDSSTSRETREDIAHEEWTEVDIGVAQQGLSFTIPPDAPFSYRGTCLSFEWRAEACEIARLRPDPVASFVFEVRP